jgi:hypothetical protein
MGNIIYDLKIVNEKIREDLKRELPSFSFSVKKDNRSIYIVVLSGNIKPFRAFSKAEENNYINTSINQYYIDDDMSLSEAGKELVKRIKAITDKYNYDNSEINSDYVDKNFYLRMYIGSSQKPYVYKVSGKPTSKPTRPVATNSDDELVYSFKSGWKMLKRKVKDKFVFVLAKDKETPNNKEDWASIKGEILTETGFKWSPQYQVFTKWDKLPENVYSNLDRIFFKYYVTPQPNATQQMMAQATATPQQEPQAEQKPQVEIAESTANPTDARIKSLLKTFKEPELVNDIEARKFIINTLLDRVEGLFEVAKTYTEDNLGGFLKNYADTIFAPISYNYNVGDAVTYIVSNGIKFDFSSESAKRKTKKDLLLRIMDLAGCFCGLDVVFGIYVSVGGEANSTEGKEYAEDRAKEENREVYIEQFHVGGTLNYIDWYSLNNTLEIAKNFLDNVFEASFKYPEFTEKFKKSLQNDGDVQLADKDYKGNDIISEAKLYSYRTINSFVYILQQGGYAGLYSNSFNLGYAMMIKLIKEDAGLNTYLKDVDPFAGGLVGAREFLSQLKELFPEIFGMPITQTAPTEDKAVLQSRIDELENFLKIAGDMDEYDKKVILSEILDLHTLLKLI